MDRGVEGFAGRLDGQLVAPHLRSPSLNLNEFLKTANA